MVAADVIVMPGLLLLGRPVHHGSTIIDLADLVAATRDLEQDPLGGRRLLPASIWAMIAMFRTLARSSEVVAHKASVFSRSRWGLRLPAVDHEGLVGLGHLVGVLTLLHGVAAAVGGRRAARSADARSWSSRRRETE